MAESVSRIQLRFGRLGLLGAGFAGLLLTSACSVVTESGADRHRKHAGAPPCRRLILSRFLMRTRDWPTLTLLTEIAVLTG